MLRVGRVNGENRLEHVGGPIDTVISEGKYRGQPSQVEISVEKGTIYWTTPDGFLRKEKVNGDRQLETVGRPIDTPVRESIPSQKKFVVANGVLYWITQDDMFARAVLKKE